MAHDPLSLRAYAKYRKQHGLPGGSLQAVQRAIAHERISFVIADGTKRIPDPEAADREWADNTDLTRAPGYLKEWAEDGAGDDDAEGDGESLKTASAREKHYKALLARLNYEQRAGELVPRKEMLAVMAAHYSTVRAKLLGLPSKAKQRLPHLTLADLATLDEIVREGLEDVVQALAQPDLVEIVKHLMEQTAA
jgi:phage terminase Nu1 subunit (DNA packaging protein)